MAAKILVSAEFEEIMWVYTISSSDNIYGHDKVSDKTSVFETLQSQNR